MAFYVKDGAFHEVKNLGWCLRHARKHVIQYAGFNYAPQEESTVDGQFIIKFDDCAYFTDFGDLTVCVRWIRRPLLYGVEFRVVRLGEPRSLPMKFMINSEEHRKICKLKYEELLEAVLPKIY